MRIDANPPNTSIKITQQGTGTSAGWRVGTLLQATVRQHGGQTQLAIGGERYTTTSPLPLRDGTPLQLRVAQTQPPLLQVVAARTEQTAAHAALRRILPQQPTLTPLVQALRSASGGARAFGAPSTGPPPGQAIVSAPPGLASSGTALLQSPAASQAVLPPLGREPSLPQVTTQAPRGEASALDRIPLPSAATLERPEGVRQALSRSGLLLESNLARFPAQAHAVSAQDFKANLLRVLNEAQARERAADVVNEVKAPLTRAIARLQLLQIHAASADGLDLLFEIPLRFHEEVELLQLRVRRDGAGNADEDEMGAPLRVQLAFNFTDIGAIHAHLLLAGQRISTNWWAESAATAEALDRALPELADNLEAAGFQVAAASCQHGAPPKTIDADIGPRQGVLDERA